MRMCQIFSAQTPIFGGVDTRPCEPKQSRVRNHPLGPVMSAPSKPRHRPLRRAPCAALAQRRRTPAPPPRSTLVHETKPALLPCAVCRKGKNQCTSKRIGACLQHSELIDGKAWKMHDFLESLPMCGLVSRNGKPIKVLEAVHAHRMFEDCTQQQCPGNLCEVLRRAVGRKWD